MNLILLVQICEITMQITTIIEKSMAYIETMTFLNYSQMIDYSSIKTTNGS